MSKQVTADKLIEDLQVVVHDAEALLKATAAQTGETIREARARTEESVRRAKNRIGDVEVEALKRVRAVAGEAEDFVRANPWQIVGTVAGMALLLGLLISRR
jgi:ElaB/YqjD/DUF883 family membrane-anchored ribosome-binding protein